MVADRNRLADSGATNSRISSATGVDLVEQFRARYDQADFAPNFSAGAGIADAVLVDAGLNFYNGGAPLDDSSGYALVDNGGPAGTLGIDSGAITGIGSVTWTAGSGTTTVMSVTSPLQPVPQDQVNITCAMSLRTLGGVTALASAVFSVEMFDQVGVSLGVFTGGNGSGRAASLSPDYTLTLPTTVNGTLAASCQLKMTVTGSGAFPFTGTVGMLFYNYSLTAPRTHTGVFFGKMVPSKGIQNMSVQSGSAATFQPTLSTTMQSLVAVNTIFANPDLTQNTAVLLTATSFGSSVNAAQINMQMRVGISLDGGATFTFSLTSIARVGNIAGGSENVPMAVTFQVTGVPTGAIKIAVQGEADSAAFASYSFQNIMWTAITLPVA